MTNDEDLTRIRQGAVVWNDWREQNPEQRVDLWGADLRGAKLPRANLEGALLCGANLQKTDLWGADLRGVNLEGANLEGADLRSANLHSAKILSSSFGLPSPPTTLIMANLSRADLEWAKLEGADLRGVNLEGANLSGANLIGAKLRRAKMGVADLSGANLREADLSGADLSGANLTSAILIKTNLTDADLTGCRVYGLSAWDLKLEGAKQRDLVITTRGQPVVTVDNLEVGQFIYLLLHNEKIRDVIDTIGKKGVLLLGRFTEGRLAILERLREELRRRDFVPMVFNFNKPETKDFTETVRLLAGLSRFVIADITNPRSAPLELQAAVPEYMIPFVPIIEVGEEPFAMFQDLWVKHRAWVLDPIAYGSVEELVWGLDEEIIKPALARFDELLVKKAEPLRVRRIGT